MTTGTSDSDPSGSTRRNRAITSAVLTSLASKVGTVLLQFVSIPIAYRVLGETTFGIYSTIAISIGTVILFQIGIGPALTHGISRALTSEDRLLEKQYFSTSWFLLVALTLIGGLIAGAVLTFVPLTAFFGEKYSGLEPQLLPGLWLALGIILLEFILSHTERAREGFLQVHINNSFGAAGNVLGAITIAAGIPFFPTVEFLILAIFGTRALARVANTAHLFWQRPDLAPKLSLFRRPLANEMLSDGFAFTISQSVTGIVELNICGLLVANFAGPAAVGHFQILMQLSSLMLGMIIMFTTPTWPAVVDAYSRQDFSWIQRVVKRLWLLVGTYSLGVLIFLPLLGPYVLGIIFGEDFDLGWKVLLPFAFYFATSSWGHTNNALLIGVGLVKRAAVFSLAETLLLILPAALGLAWMGLPGLFGGMAVTMIAVTTWLFPLMLVQRIRSHSQQSSVTL
jgi:O-antigen/teichoic acid export membrane protein